MIYQLKITLLGIKPPIWRRILIDPTMTMEELHFVTQSAMGWMAEHLYSFTSGKRQIVDPEADEENDSDFSDEVLVGQAFRAVGDKWDYLYDFGDNWEHEIVLEKIVDLDPAVAYPVCIDGARACPPEDCGGVDAYENMLEVLADPKHEDYAELTEWLGGDFDPEEFDKEIVNEELHDPENWIEDDELDGEEE